jgi:hypothetical protein
MNLKQHVLKQRTSILQQKKLNEQRRIEEQRSNNYNLVWRIVSPVIKNFMNYSKFLETVKVQAGIPNDSGMVMITFPEAAQIMIRVSLDGLFPNYSPLLPIDEYGNLFAVSSYEYFEQDDPFWGWTYWKHNFGNFTEALAFAYEQWDQHLKIND